MKGQGTYSVLAQNLMALNLHSSTQRSLHRRPKMCWKCQKDKPTLGGHIKAQAGLFKFICKDCMDAKKLKDVENA